MSRVARMPVSLPQGVTTTITGDTVTVKGAKGTISLPLRPGLTLVQEASRRARRACRDATASR